MFEELEMAKGFGEVRNSIVLVLTLKMVLCKASCLLPVLWFVEFWEMRGSPRLEKLQQLSVMMVVRLILPFCHFDWVSGSEMGLGLLNEAVSCDSSACVHLISLSSLLLSVHLIVFFKYFNFCKWPQSKHFNYHVQTDIENERRKKKGCF